MARIKYDINLIKYISLFESITQVKVKDCISNGRLTFIVHEGDLGKAVGKKGANAKMLENVIRKRIRMVEFSSEVTEFIKNLIYPINAREIAEKNGIVMITAGDVGSKGMLIGRDRQNLVELKSIVTRHFHVEDIKIL
ncbi:NusA-like transcription termination signal-binding factor [Candidatus Woesearchaeota archaeon]|nr:NusA-like transcription termination signal-binding factor [Candidatus Woesearchaeota archaeon]